MSKLKIIKDDGVVSLCLDCDSTFCSFLDVYIDDGVDASPFKTIEEAEMFVGIIKKLLEKVHDFE